MLVGGGCRAEGNKGEKKWDNCHSIINKIYFLKRKKIKRTFHSSHYCLEKVPESETNGVKPSQSRPWVGTRPQLTVQCFAYKVLISWPDAQHIPRSSSVFCIGSTIAQPPSLLQTGPFLPAWCPFASVPLFILFILPEYHHSLLCPLSRLSNATSSRKSSLIPSTSPWSSLHLNSLEILLYCNLPILGGWGR